jgi:hypothetical protein
MRFTKNGTTLLADIRPTREKQSSFLQTSVNYSCKSLEHWVQNVNYASKSLIGFAKVARAIYIYC